MRLLWAEIVMPHLVLESPLSGLPLKHIYYVFLSYIVHRNWTSDKMLGFMLSYVFVFITHKHCSSRPVCLALLAISFLNIKCFFFFFLTKKIGAYCGLCCLVYMFSEGTSWSYDRKLWRRI